MLPDKPQYASRSHTFLKGEAFVAAVMAGGFSFDRLVLSRRGAFSKSYRNDIEAVLPKKDDQDNPVMHVQLNRDGIYDRLPEGLFHQPRATGAATAGISQMLTEYRRFREEEKAARRFFQPLEQELFRYATAVEQQEQQVLWGMLSGDLDNSFARFWDLEEGLPAGPASVLLRLMPWAHLVKGNAVLCATALSMMLDKPVQVQEQVVPWVHASDDTFVLGNGALGVDTVTGRGFEEPALRWVFSIGALEGKQIAAFMSDAPYGRFLQQFIDIFIPLEVDAVFEYEVPADRSKDEAPILGYSLTL